MSDNSVYSEYTDFVLKKTQKYKMAAKCKPNKNISVSLEDFHNLKKESPKDFKASINMQKPPLIKDRDRADTVDFV